MAIVDGCIRCNGCGELKATTDFAPSFVKRGRGRCRPCNLRYGKAWSAAASPEELERIRATRRSYNQKTKAKRQAVDLARRQSPGWKETRRSWVLSAAYGISVAQYDAMLVSQDGGCACCGAKANRSGKRLFVDHDHATGVVRGLLCNKCNQGIGALGDNIAGVRRALNYLERAEPVAQSPAPTMRINLLNGAN